MRVLAIDPGNEQSAFCLFADGQPIAFKKVANYDFLSTLRHTMDGGYDCVCERIRSYGMPAGATLFETCEWSGRFQEAWESKGMRYQWHWLPRKDVKLHLCGSMRAKDPNVRQAIIDRFGGKAAAIGTKKNPGPLHGCTKDCWAAVAVGLTWIETRSQEAAA